MNLLIDTHVLLWWFTTPEKLSSEAAQTIENGKNTAFVSAAAIWEIVIKKRLGKLTVPDGLVELMQQEGFTPLSITMDHALALEALPDIHADPFDRIMIAQARKELLTFITADQHIMQYEVSTIKAI